MAANNKDMKKKSTRMSTTNAKNLKRIDAFLIFYFTYLTMNGGATVGKRFFQLRVLRQDGSGLNAGRAFMRTMIYPLSLTLWFVNVLSALLLDGRMIHDIVVGSWVVRVEL